MSIEHRSTSYETCLFVICCACCLTWHYLHVVVLPCLDVTASVVKMCGAPAPLLYNRILLHDHSTPNHSLLFCGDWNSKEIQFSRWMRLHNFYISYSSDKHEEKIPSTLIFSSLQKHFLEIKVHVSFSVAHTESFCCLFQAPVTSNNMLSNVTPPGQRVCIALMPIHAIVMWVTAYSHFLAWWMEGILWQWWIIFQNPNNITAILLPFA